MEWARYVAAVGVAVPEEVGVVGGVGVGGGVKETVDNEEGKRDFRHRTQPK